MGWMLSGSVKPQPLNDVGGCPLSVTTVAPEQAWSRAWFWKVHGFHQISSLQDVHELSAWKLSKPQSRLLSSWEPGLT